jgi:hypothetical protein
MFFLPLNLKKIDVVSPNWVSPKNMVIWKDEDYVKEIFVPSFLEKLSSISKVIGAVIFNKTKHQIDSNAHVDVELINNQLVYINYGLNIVFDNSTDIPSKMKWYSRRFPNMEKKVLMSAGNTPYMNFDIGELYLEAEHCINEYVTLVRTDVPHSISLGNGHRTCISVRFDENYDWDTATNLFNKTFNQ